MNRSHPNEESALLPRSFERQQETRSSFSTIGSDLTHHIEHYLEDCDLKHFADDGDVRDDTSQKTGMTPVSSGSMDLVVAALQDMMRRHSKPRCARIDRKQADTSEDKAQVTDSSSSTISSDLTRHIEHYLEECDLKHFSDDGGARDDTSQKTGITTVSSGSMGIVFTALQDMMRRHSKPRCARIARKRAHTSEDEAQVTGLPVEKPKDSCDDEESYCCFDDPIPTNVVMGIADLSCSMDYSQALGEKLHNPRLIEGKDSINFCDGKMWPQVARRVSEVSSVESSSESLDFILQELKRNINRYSIHRCPKISEKTKHSFDGGMDSASGEHQNDTLRNFVHQEHDDGFCKEEVLLEVVRRVSEASTGSMDIILQELQRSFNRHSIDQCNKTSKQIKTRDDNERRRRASKSADAIVSCHEGASDLVGGESKKRVSFSVIEVRRYEDIPGESPSFLDRPPVSIGGGMTEEVTIMEDEGQNDLKLENVSAGN